MILVMSTALFCRHYAAFNPITTIEFSIQESGFVTLVIYNIMGQKVRELVADTMQAGVHSAVWNGEDENNIAVSSGIYICRLQTSQFTKSNKMLLIR